MGNRYMTLSDLHNYFSAQGKNQKFSCQDDGDTIVVQVGGKLNFSKSDSMDGLYPTRVQMNFVGDNLNNSRIEMKAQEAALSSSNYRPLLACIHEVDGEPQFWGHNMHQDDDGELVYDEQPVGVIAEEAHIEHDDEYDMDYAVAQGYIWEEYSKAAYILERDQKCDVSVELSIRSLSYDAKDNILVLDDFYYSGCTILGMDENGKKVNPAMPGSNITLADFSAKNNSTVTSDKLIQAIERLNNTLSKFEENTLGKEDSTLKDNELEQFEEETKKILPDDDVVEDEESTTDPTPAPISAVSEEPEEAEEEEVAEEEASETPDEEESDDVQEDASSDNEEFSIKHTIQIGEEIKEFSVSMNAKLDALSKLVNDTYSEDYTWYSIEAYDDEKQVVMIDCWNGKAYRQSYKVKDDVFSLKGDRVEVFSTWMTADEQKAFDKMKADFSSISEKLEKYESEPVKTEILDSAKYNYVSNTDEFVELKNNHFDLSIDDVKAKANEILLSYAEQGKLQFSVENEEGKVGAMKLPNANKKVSRYGNLFSK